MEMGNYYYLIKVLKLDDILGLILFELLLVAVEFIKKFAWVVWLLLFTDSIF